MPAANRVAPVALLLAAAVSMLYTAPARAACACICVDGQNRPLCSEVTDIEPLCPPKLCPTAPPTSRPLDPPRLPPIDTRSCAMEYVYNRYAGRYEWRQLCR
ncbi:MAG TPA: hypothetical protein VKB27_22405 [Gammaproteobacteria bacterium]|nr:hypothetical protein [Gammaproteobacteria bacterium]